MKKLVVWLIQIKVTFQLQEELQGKINYLMFKFNKTNFKFFPLFKRLIFIWNAKENYQLIKMINK